VPARQPDHQQPDADAGGGVDVGREVVGIGLEGQRVLLLRDAEEVERHADVDDGHGRREYATSAAVLCS